MAPRSLLFAALGAALAACSGAPDAATPRTSSDPVTVTLAPPPAPTAPPSASAVARTPEPVSREQLEQAMLAALNSGGAGGGSNTLGAGSSGPGLAGLAQGAPIGSAAPAGPKRTAAVKIGGITIIKGGPIGNASAVVAGMAAGFRRCNSRGLTVDPSSVKDGAAAHLIAEIGPNGEVLSVKPTSTSGLSQEVVSCMVARAASAVFAPPASGTATITIPVTISIQSVP